MRLAVKAALWSGVAYPGFGQWKLGRRLKGGLIMLAVTAAVAVMFFRLWFLVYNAMVPDGDPTQMSISPEIIETIHRQAYVDNWWLLLIIVVFWIGSTIDAYRDGKRLEASLPTYPPYPGHQPPYPYYPPSAPSQPPEGAGSAPPSEDDGEGGTPPPVPPPDDA